MQHCMQLYKQHCMQLYKQHCMQPYKQHCMQLYKQNASNTALEQACNITSHIACNFISNVACNATLEQACNIAMNNYRLFNSFHSIKDWKYKQKQPVCGKGFKEVELSRFIHNRSWEMPHSQRLTFIFTDKIQKFHT